MKRSARGLAVEFLEEVLAGRRHADSLSRDRRFLEMEVRERRLSMELVNGVLRKLPLLDYQLALLADRPLSRIDQPVLWILRLGLYQIGFLRIPARAAVHETVELCRLFRRTSAKAFVNALLRRFLRHPPEAPGGAGPEDLAIRHGHPEWLVRRYLQRYGSEQAIRLMERNNTTPRPPLWVNPFRIDFEDFKRRLRGEGISFRPHPRLSGCLLVPRGFAAHRLYRNGYCFFMDEGSQGIVRQADLEGCRVVGDFCAAPGGKAFLLASRLPKTARLHASDANWRRLLGLRRRAQRGRVPLDLVRADLTQLSPFREVFDFVLLDVPCSGLGTLGANPDIRWKVREPDLTVLANRQLSILSNGFTSLKPGGRLVYSTCSTEPEENERVVERFLASNRSAFQAGEYDRNFPGGRGQAFFRALIGHAE